MSDIRMASKIKATVPAIGNQEVVFQVNYISPLADFATWTSTKTSGGFDVKSFEIHAAPVQPVDGLRPGMSVLINWKQFEEK